MTSARSEMGSRAPTSLPITIADVRAAAARIAGRLPRTSSAVSETLPEIARCRVYLKFEIFQFTASFKERVRSRSSWR